MLNAKMIGDKIADARKKISLSQAQLAERLSISSQAVGKWERGESMPDIITFNRLAELLGVDLNYFSENMPYSQSRPAAFDEQEAIDPIEAGKKLNWNMSRANWVGADFSGLKDLHEKFSASNMKNCLFIGSDLSGLLLRSNNVEDCDFSGSDISSSQIRGSHLANDQFKECSLKETLISGSHVEHCDFSNVDFTDVTIKACDFSKNTLDNAIWNRTSFNMSQISNTTFHGNILNCSFEYCSFSKVTFKDALLQNTFFKTRSLRRIKFVNCKADRITYEFLKNGKADLNGVELVLS